MRFRDAKKNHLVSKQNVLNEMRSYDMTLQELRFLIIYLSKINHTDLSTRVVKFTISELEGILGIGPSVRTSYYQDVARSLLSKSIEVPAPGGFKMFNLFNYVKVFTDDKDGKTYFEFNAHDEALPLLFEYQNKYFSYQLWNALYLRSKNQIRMYEILKQYEWLGTRVISVESLKEQLGISENEYDEFKYFRKDVLDVCQKAINENTDISFTYEVHSRKQRKIHELKFDITRNISKNEKYTEHETFRNLIGMGGNPVIESDLQETDFDDVDENGIVRSTGRHWRYEEKITFLMSACNDEFTREQMIVLLDNIPKNIESGNNASYDYLQTKYREMDMRKPEKSRFGYLKKMIIEEASDGKSKI